MSQYGRVHIWRCDGMPGGEYYRAEILDLHTYPETRGFWYPFTEED